MGGLIALLLLCGLAILPIGFRGVYCQSRPGVWLLIGPLKIRVYPGRPRENKAKQKKASGQRKQSATDNSKMGGSYRDFLPIVRTIFAFLEHFRRKIRVNDLQFKIILAGDDPSTLAINYGRAWTALGNLMPHLERLFVIKKRDLEVECDFTSDMTLIYAKADVTITVARTIHLLSRYGIRVLKDLLNLRKLRKGGAKL